MINIEAKSLDELIEKFSKVDVEDTLNKGIKKSIFSVERKAITKTPVDTGVLRKSYETFFESLQGTLFNYRRYGVFVHEGTKYIKGNPFLTEAAEESEDRVNYIMNKEIKKTLNTLKN